MTKPPAEWIREIQMALAAAKLLPPSSAPPFPWDGIAAKISSLTELSDVTVAPRRIHSLPAKEISSGFGAAFLAIPFEMTPLSGHAFFLMSKEDVTKLTSAAILSSHQSRGLSSSKFQEGFYYFLLNLCLEALDQLKAFDSLSVKLSTPRSLPLEEALCIDIEIEFSGQMVWGRVVCPLSLKEAFQTHFNTKPPPALTSDLIKHLNVNLQCQLGETTLSVAKYQKIRVGDFLLLDRCSFDPKTLKGTATLCLENIPLLRARIKEGNVKIIDYVYHRQEEESIESEEELADTDEHLWSATEESESAPSNEPSITLIVETTPLALPLEKLISLSPDAPLELSIHPEQGVDLISKERKVAKGELIKLGEMIGVKILQIG